MERLKINRKIKQVDSYSLGFTAGYEQADGKTKAVIKSLEGNIIHLSNQLKYQQRECERRYKKRVEQEANRINKMLHAKYAKLKRKIQKGRY